MRERLRNVSLVDRVLIGNSAVIVVGAIGGTLLTRHLAVMGNLGLILLFIFLGIPLSLLVNYLLVCTALRPLRELRIMVDQVRAGQPRIPGSMEVRADPDIRQLEEAINSMLGRLQNKAAQLRAISERAINAHEEERRRIARGLHDDTAQALSTLIINLERLQTESVSDVPGLRGRLNDAHQLATRALEDLRKIVFDLRPTMLDDLGLVPAIRWYANSSFRPIGVHVSFEIDDESIRLPSHLETLLFRIAQEAVNNVVNHADAHVVRIGLHQSPNAILLEVEDDGRGFDVAQSAGEALRKKRLGILGIQERAALVGGTVDISSEPERGTNLQVSVPLPREGTNGKTLREALKLDSVGMSP